MTMLELRDFTNANGLYYYHVYGTKDKVAIYKDRYHYELLGFTFVSDYRPIKNYKAMGHGKNHNSQVLKILKKNASHVVEAMDDKIIIEISNAKNAEEYELVERWLEEKECIKDTSY